VLVACLAALVPAMPTPAGADETQSVADAQSVHDAQWALRATNAEKAWTHSRGVGVTVAVLDSGVDATHPDLVGRVTGGGDFGDGASGDGTHDAVAPRGHGTEVASLVAGTGDNYDAHGLFGLAPQARILSFGVYRNGRPDAAAVAKAVRAAVHDGAQVILAPPTGRKASPAVVAAVRRAMDQDVVVVAGDASPRGSSADLTGSPRPSYIPGVVTVAAVDRQGKVPQPTQGSRAALGAPGVDVLAASSDGTYWTGDDSGFAASWVAGAAALVRAAHPDWTAAQTIQKLLETAGRTECSKGCGYGLVNPFRAVSDAARPTSRTNPLLTAPVPRNQAATASTRLNLESQRLLLFLVAGLGALVLYVAVTALFIHRQRDVRQ
jgi:subtilisin family serine protease